MAFSDIENNSIIICPSSIKDVLIKYFSKNNPLMNVKYFSKEELKEGLYFSYDYKAIHYVHKKNIRYENAEEQIKNLYFIKGFNDKTNKLFDLYNELENKKLLIHNDVFIHHFKNKKIYIIGYSSLDEELKHILEPFGNNYSYLEVLDLHDETRVVKNYKYLNDEINALFIDIFSKLESGVSLNDIKLYQPSLDYETPLYIYALNHNIHINNVVSYLNESPIFDKFMANYKELEIEEAYKKMDESVYEDAYDAKGVLIKAINKIAYLNLPKDESIELLNYVASKERLKQIRYKESLDIVNSESIINDNQYLYILGFSNDTYPTVKKDIDYLTDKEKSKLNLNTSLIENQIAHDSLINLIKRTKNVSISFKKNLGKHKFFPSLLVEEMGYSLNKTYEVIPDVRYSSNTAYFEVAKAKDAFEKYREESPYRNVYKDEEINYKSYDHTFKGINATIDGHLKISYTQIEEYKECPFSYYVNRILKGGDFEDSFSARLGTFFHLILEENIDKNTIPTLEDYQNKLDEYFKTSKEKFFVKLLYPQLVDVINKNFDFNNNTKYVTKKAELHLIHDVKDKDTTIDAKIDKVLIDEENRCLLVVDYKTGKFSFDEEKAKAGFKMQLPMYAYLLEELSKKEKIGEVDNYYNGFVTQGMYIQRLLYSPNEISSIKEDDLYKLAGITCIDENYIRNLDTSLGQKDENDKFVTKSEFISQLVITTPKKEGQFVLAKGKKSNKTAEEIDALIASAKDNIDKFIDNVRAGKFEIAPVEFSSNETPCRYCKFKAICYKNSGDAVDGKSLLKGDE